MASDGETLKANGIELPAEWPPIYIELTRDLRPVPYLENPPAVIPIDIGRQLFVDDFLIEQTSLQCRFYTQEYVEEPVIRPEKPWENQRRGSWYDPADELFKMWYTAGWHRCVTPQARMVSIGRSRTLMFGKVLTWCCTQCTEIINISIPIRFGSITMRKTLTSASNTLRLK